MKITMKKSALTAVLFALALTFYAPIASATTVSECQALIANLKAETADTTNRLSDKDRAGLIATLDAASLKLDQVKFCDAIQKLNNFKATVAALAAAPKPKINQDPTAGVTAQQLIADADAAINCINQLAIETNGVGCF